MPYVYYPIQDDDRATGFLLPTYGSSRLRGQAMSNAFFWAIGRSQDATFFHDWFTSTGQGVGGEYRYIAAAQSLGNARVYWLDQHEATYTDDGQTSTLPATRSFEVTGNMNHTISPRVRARARLDYFSDVVTQQLYYQDVYQATRNNRLIEGGLTAAFGPTSTSAPVLEKRIHQRCQQLHGLRKHAPHIDERGPATVVRLGRLRVDERGVRLPSKSLARGRRRHPRRQPQPHRRDADAACAAVEAAVSLREHQRELSGDALFAP